MFLAKIFMNFHTVISNQWKFSFVLKVNSILANILEIFPFFTVKFKLFTVIVSVITITS